MCELAQGKCNSVSNYDDSPRMCCGDFKGAILNRVDSLKIKSEH